MSRRPPLVGYEKAAAMAIAQAKWAIVINNFAERLQQAITSAIATAAGFIEQLGRELVRLAAILEPVQDARVGEGRALLARHRRRRC